MAIRAVKAQIAENQFNNLLVTMGLNVDEAVGKAIAALLHSNSHIVAGVMESAVAIQELEIKLHQAVFSELERCDLPRSEIQRLTSIINISKDLARLGKLAANLGRKVTEVGKHNEHEDFSRLQPLAIAVSHLCRQTLRSLTRLDLVLARSAAAGSASVDAYRDYVLRNLNGHQQRTATEQDDLHLIFASRCLEQIADHAIHLAESLVEFLSGEYEPEQSHSMAS
jgi:phosphate transport system protein